MSLIYVIFILNFISVFFIDLILNIILISFWIGIGSKDLFFVVIVVLSFLLFCE